MIMAAALSFAACQPEDNPDPDTQKDPIVNPEPTPEPELNQDLEFTLEMNSLLADQASINVKNNGTAADTWYGFYTDDTDASESSLITAEVKNLIASGDFSGLKNNTSTVVTLLNLNPNTSYRYIVLGLSEEGEFYGTSASIKFTTLKNEVTFTENAAWNVEYTGAGNINGTVYEHTVTVTSSDANPYFITAVTKDEFETLGIKALAEDNLSYLKKYISDFNKENGTNYSLNDILFRQVQTGTPLQSV